MNLTRRFVENTDICEGASDVARDTNRRIGTLAHYSFSFMIVDLSETCRSIAYTLSESCRTRLGFFPVIILAVSLDVGRPIGDIFITEIVGTNLSANLSTLNDQKLPGRFAELARELVNDEGWIPPCVCPVG